MNAYHSNFKLRIWQTGGSGSGYDYYHIDDIYIEYTIPYAVEVTPSYNYDWTIPSIPVDYTFSVENQGSQDDTYDLLGTGEYNIKFRDYANTKDITTLAVDSGQTEQFLARVTIPGSKPNWDVGRNYVEVRSQNDTGVNDTAYMDTTNAGDLVRVGVYNHPGTGDISYFSGTNSNYYSHYYDELMADPMGRFFPIVVDDLSPSALWWLDALVLPDNAVPDADLTDVDDWFTPYRGIIAVDSAACYATYSGYLHPSGQGTNGRDVYWDYGSGTGDQKVIVAHKITEGYTVGNTYNSYSGNVEFYKNGLVKGAFPLTAKYSDPGDIYVAARDVPGDGRIVGLGPYPNVPSGLRDLFYNSILWTLTPAEFIWGGFNRAPPSVTQSDAMVSMANLTLRGHNEQFNLTSISLNRTGTGSDSDVEKVYLTRDMDGTGNYTSGDLILASGDFAGGQLTFQGPWTIPGDKLHTYVIAYNVSDEAEAGETLGVRVNHHDVRANNSVIMLGSALVQSLNTTITDRADKLLVEAKSLAPPTAEQGETDVAMLSAELEAVRYNITVDGIGVDLEGTGGASDIDEVRLYLDDDGDGEFDPDEDMELDGDTFSGSSITFNGLAMELQAGEPVTLFWAFDISDTAELGATVALGLTDDMVAVNLPDRVGPFDDFTTYATRIVDTMAPDYPLELDVTDVTYHSISLEWEPNTEKDLEGYNLYRSTQSNPAYWGAPVNGDELITDTRYVDDGLEELTRYYYVLAAGDEVPNESEYSDDVHETTLLGPHGPEVTDIARDELTMKEDTVDRSVNLQQWFSDINMDPLTFSHAGGTFIAVVIDHGTGGVVITPDENWFGEETITFTADDLNSGVAEHDLTVIVTPVNDPPGPAEIIAPEDGWELEGGEEVSFQGACPDPDLPFGEDLLIFTWSSDLDGELGKGETIEDVILSVGVHEITLGVVDIERASASAAIEVTVLPGPDTDSDGDGLPDLWEEEHGLDPEDSTDASKTNEEGKTYLEQYEEENPGGGGGDGGDGGDGTTVDGGDGGTGDGGDGGGEDGTDGTTPGTGDTSSPLGGGETGTQTLLWLMIIIVIVIVVVLALVAVVLKRKRDREEEERGRRAAAAAAYARQGTRRPRRMPPAVIDMQGGGGPRGRSGMGPGTGGRSRLGSGARGGGPGGTGGPDRSAGPGGGVQRKGSEALGGVAAADDRFLLPAPKDEKKDGNDPLKSWSVGKDKPGELPEDEGDDRRGRSGGRMGQVPGRTEARSRSGPPRMEPKSGSGPPKMEPKSREGPPRMMPKKDSGPPGMEPPGRKKSVDIDVKLPEDYGADGSDIDDDLFDI